ncbi:MAG: hypothetical protein PHI11_11720 [Gallionella sp.]|nr:hypothetical protein [Gallionella sp.]
MHELQTSLGRINNLATTSTNITLNGNSISKTSGTTGWNADAYSQNGYAGGAYVSARAGQTNLPGMFGLNSDPTTDSNYTSLDYAWYPRQGKRIKTT